MNAYRFLIMVAPCLVGAVVPVSAQIYRFDVPGSSNTIATSINTSGAITGYYAGTSSYHGFVRNPSGKIITFDPSSSVGTDPTSINTSGAITGSYADSAEMRGRGFVRDPHGSMTVFDAPSSIGTAPTSINTSGTITGNYSDASGVRHGFIRGPSGSITTFDAPGSIDTFPYSINTSGAITGSYADASSVYHGFVRAPSGSITTFDPPSSIATYPDSINTSGAITGYYVDPSSVSHGFVRNPSGSITTFDPPNSNDTGAHSINTSGAITGIYQDASSILHGFVRDPLGNITTFDAPRSKGTWVNSINTGAAITGYYGRSIGAAGVSGFVGTVPNGLDVSKYSGNVSDGSWQSAILSGVSFVVVQGWGGLSKSGRADSQLLGAEGNNIVGAAYTLLNFLSYGGSGKYLGGGKYQVDQAIAAAGSGMSNVKFIAIDVEPCCTTTSQWQANHPYKAGSEVVDPNGNMQYTAKGGVSGAKAPTWNDSGGPTKDGNVVWHDYGVPLDQTDSLQVIRDAVSEVKTKSLKPVIYTSRSFWKTITGGCGTASCSDLIALPLWDIENKSFTAGDGKKHCGDGIAGLVPFTPYPNSGWQFRSGNQYDLGLAPSGGYNSEITASLMQDNPARAAGCQGDKFFRTAEDLDYFDPTLFQ